MPIPKLLQQQNHDGGWSYRRGGSWTEPTVYALLALADAGDAPAVERGLQWVRQAQCGDGGWQVRPGVGESCWVTSLVALLPAERLGADRHRRAVAWLAESTGMESTILFRIRQWMMGGRTSPEVKAPGWPWVAGSAAWVIPTSLAVLALSRENQVHPAPGLAARLDEGRRFLINRMCKGGGWNHGSTRALGYETGAYPETTGIALAALRGFHGPQTDESLAVALRFLGQCHTGDALNWLRLGLAAHGRMPEGYSPPPDIAYRTVPEIATSLLADRAIAGKSAFWS